MLEQTRLLRFVHEDTQICNPFESECGRFSVDPVEAYGFVVRGTGGGCEALELYLENGNVLRLTDESGMNLPDSESLGDSLIGLYDQDNEELACASLADVWDDYQAELEGTIKQSPSGGR